MLSLQSKLIHGVTLDPLSNLHIELWVNHWLLMRDLHADGVRLTRVENVKMVEPLDRREAKWLVDALDELIFVFGNNRLIQYIQVLLSCLERSINRWG